MVGHGPAVLAAGAVRVGCFLFFVLIWSILSSFSNGLSVGRGLGILKYCCLSCYNPAVVTTGGVLAKYWLTT